MEKVNFLKLFLLFFCTSFFSVKCDITYSSNSTETTDRRVDNSGNAVVFSANLTLDGAGYIYSFPPTYSSSNFLVVNNSVSATITNLMFQYLRPEHVALGSGSDLIFGNGCNIQLGDSSTLSYVLKFGGASSILDGRHKTLTLGSSGVIEVQSGGNLTLRNITLYDVMGTNLRCADNTATITFDNVKIINRNSWSFATGAFAVINNLTLAGGGNFVYQSAYASTVNDNSTLFLTDGMTFSYDPAKGSGQAVAGQQNLIFTNTSSKLWCDGVTLKVTNTGMRLTKGTLQFDRKCSMYSDANLSDTSHALILGDKNSDNDPQVIFGPDAKVALESGVLEYDLVEYPNLKYGDGLVLKHKAYGFYLYWGPFDTGFGQRYVVGNPIQTASSGFYVEPALSSFRFGVGVVGTNVLTGDLLRFDNMVDNVNFVSIAFYPYPPLVSTPQPPYGSVTVHNSVVFGACRLYKKGGSVGTSITLGDSVYWWRFYSGAVGYIGSKNLTYSTSYKEIINYQMPDNTPAQPPNMDSDYIWEVFSIIQKAYLTGPANDNIFGVPGESWPAASNYQF